MAAVVKFQEDWPSTLLTLNLPLTVEHTMRILLKHGGRLVECAPERISYRSGEMSFTVHYFIEDDRAFTLFADQFGWALHETTVMKLIEEGVICSGIDIT